MSVIIASVRTPFALPLATIDFARARAPARSFMNAPLPDFTSMTRPPIPSAIFFDRIDAVISGMLSTVAVTSRSAYSFLSAGAISAVAPIMTQPTSRRIVRISPSGMWTRKPAIASSLSSVPPVWPSPRPDIIGT